MCGTTIGEQAFVGAGSVVIRDVPAHALVVANPARRIGWMCACGEKLDSFLGFLQKLGTLPADVFLADFLQRDG